MNRRRFCRTIAAAGTAMSLDPLAIRLPAAAAEQESQTATGCQQVKAYLNLDADEVTRQLQLRLSGLRDIQPIVLPEGDMGFYGWPHGGIVGETLLVKDACQVKSWTSTVQACGWLFFYDPATPAEYCESVLASTMH